MKNPAIGAELNLEEIFAAERGLVPYRDEIRQRAFARAKLVTVSPLAPTAPSRAWSMGQRGWFVGGGLALASIGAAVVAMHRPARPEAAVPQASDAPTQSTVPEITEGAPEALPLESTSNPGRGSPRAVQAEEYERELRILEPARRAFARGDFAAVIAAADEHERMFPSGGLAEERDALRVRALFRQHRDGDARRAAAAFRRRFPHSILLDGIGK